MQSLDESRIKGQSADSPSRREPAVVATLAAEVREVSDYSTRPLTIRVSANGETVELKPGKSPEYRAFGQLFSTLEKATLEEMLVLLHLATTRTAAESILQGGTGFVDQLNRLSDEEVTHGAVVLLDVLRRYSSILLLDDEVGDFPQRRTEHNVRTALARLRETIHAGHQEVAKSELNSGEITVSFLRAADAFAEDLCTRMGA